MAFLADIANQILKEEYTPMPPRTALLYSETLLNTAAPVSLTRSAKVSRRCSEVMVSRSKSVVDQNKKKNIHSGVYSVYSIYYYYCSGTVRNHYPLSIFSSIVT